MITLAATTESFQKMLYDRGKHTADVMRHRVVSLCHVYGVSNGNDW